MAIVDPLLICLENVHSIHFGKGSIRTKLTGLFHPDKLITPSRFIRLANEVGLDAALSEVAIDQLPTVVTPAVLLLKNNSACVLHSITNQCASIKRCDAKDSQVEEIPLTALEEEYTGTCLLIKPHPTPSYDGDSENQEEGHWFWSTLYDYKKEYFVIGLASFFINLLGLASPIFVMNVYDRVVPNQATATLWALSFGIIIVFGFDFLIKQLRYLLLSHTGKNIDLRLACSLMEKLLSVKLAYKPNSIGGFSNEMNGYESVREFFTSATLTTCFDIPFILIFLVLVGYIGGPLIFVPLIAVPVVILISVTFEKFMRNSLKKAYYANLKKHSTLIESLSGIEQLRAINAQGRMQQRWEKEVISASQATLDSRFYSALTSNATGYVIQMVTVITIIWGVYLINGPHDSDKTMTIGNLIACSICNGKILAPLAQIASLISRYEQAKLGLIGLDRIMNRPHETIKRNEAIHRDNLAGDIIFRNVSFKYPNAGYHSLTNVNITIRQGSKVGVIGKMGSGKSTILRLLVQLYQPNEGQILLDGVDLKQMDPREVRNRIGYVSQVPKLFSGTLRENLTMANPYVSDEALHMIAEQTGVAELARRHPDGYQMLINECGENLSIGQQQMICIARALMTDPFILLLDEPTSAMDIQSAKRIMSMIKNKLADKMFMMVTHRHFMLDLVDTLIVFENGRIVSSGPRDRVLDSIKTRSV